MGILQVREPPPPKPSPARRGCGGLSCRDTSDRCGEKGGSGGISALPPLAFRVYVCVRGVLRGVRGGPRPLTDLTVPCERGC